jgi:hypothetical protein
MNNYTIIPSSEEYKSAPANDQRIQISLQQQNQNLIEYDRTVNVNLAQVYDDERQGSTIFRPTFKTGFLYSNVFTGSTKFIPIQNNLYYVNPEMSVFTGNWQGYPQYYEFDFFRDDIDNTHIGYETKSAFTYNWNYYITYAAENNYDSKMSATLNGNYYNWVAKDGIPFVIKENTQEGSGVISFECICPHGLTVGESVELLIGGQVFQYREETLFEVYSLGNGLFNSDTYIFNIYNLGFTGTSIGNGTIGTFKRVVNYDNAVETKSKYYVRQHKTLTNINDIIITKTGFEKNPFGVQKKLEFSSATPDNVNRISQKTSSNAFTITTNRDIDIKKLLDNQKRPITELFLTIVNRGYSGLFNHPTQGVGLKQGWLFNITKTNNSWWSDDNLNSNANIQVNSYTQTSGVTKTFYYNKSLEIGSMIDGDFCEWNDYFQVERVISPYYQKIKFNQDVFQSSQTPNNPNSAGYYYQPHSSMIIRYFSDYIEVGDPNTVDEIPSYAFYSQTDQVFRWRDLYTYGFFDNLGRGVDYPFLNLAHYPYKDMIFRLIPDDKGFDINQGITGLSVPYKPIIDKCE